MKQTNCLFLTLGTQHSMRMRHTAWPAPLYNTFSSLSHKRYDFPKKGKKPLFSIKCVLIFFYETFLIVRRILPDIIKKCVLVFM